jgi:pyruvate, orthophosphate dikinase
MTVPTSESVRVLDGSSDDDRELLGGKAWGIQHMRSLGVAVPPAFVLTTELCARFHETGGELPDDVLAALPAAIAGLERETGRTFGVGPAPLLVSVRSGAPVSMPGMMDTILNLGQSDAIEDALGRSTGDPAFAADTRRRFEEQYAEIVGEPAPRAPTDQLLGAIAAVFRSWNSKRAVAYRRDRGLEHVSGTAVTVQAMVFGNLDDRSGTGVLFSRDPLTGDTAPFGEWLPRGQGEDVVSGRHDPLPLTALAEQLPDVHAELLETSARLERDARDVQDLEFTVEAGKLWLLQSRAAKRSPQAAVRLAVALADEGVITREEALDRVSPEQAEAALRPHVDPRARASATVLATGRPACPGVVTGLVATETDDAENRALDGESVVLARPTTDPEDVPAMMVVGAVLTELGGSTSHAAVVSRELGVPCVVGCGAGELLGLAGTTVTVDGAAGEILEGRLDVAAAADDPDGPERRLAAWAAESAPPELAGKALPALLSARRT